LRGHEIRVIDYEILWRTEGTKQLFSKRQVFQVARLLKDANHIVIRPSILKIPVLDYVSMVFTYTREINRQIQEFKPDMIIGDCILTPYLAFRAARKHGIPTVYYILDISHKLIPFKFLHPLGRLLERNNFRNADQILSINQGLREYCLQMAARPDKTHVVTAGTDSKRFDVSIDAYGIREKYGIKKADLILFFVGWIHHFNGLKEVAMEITKIPDSNIKLFVVGDGDGFDELEEIRRSHNMQNRLILTGRKPYEEIPSFIAAADICILPADPNEPIMQNIVPIKMYDYLTARKPIISTRLPGIMKEFGEGNGIVYIDRPEDTVDKAIEIVQNGSIKELSSQAQRFAAQHSWDKITDEFEKILKDVAKGNEHLS